LLSRFHCYPDGFTTRICTCGAVQVPETGYCHVALPIYNTSAQAVQLALSGFSNTPFYTKSSPLPRAASPSFHPPTEPEHPKPASELFDPKVLFDTRQLNTLALAEGSETVHNIDRHEAILLHIWFVSHVPGFFSTNFSIDLIFPAKYTYGPYQLKAVCFKKQQQTEAGSENKQLGYDISSLPYPVVNSFVSLSGINTTQPPSKARVNSNSEKVLDETGEGSENAGGEGEEDSAGDPYESLDAAEIPIPLFSLPSLQFDPGHHHSHQRRTPIPQSHPGDQRTSSSNFLINLTQSGVVNSSEHLKLPAKLWIWANKTLLLTLNNSSAKEQQFKLLISHAFETNLALGGGLINAGSSYDIEVGISRQNQNLKKQLEDKEKREEGSESRGVVMGSHMYAGTEYGYLGVIDGEALSLSHTHGHTYI